MRKNKKRILQVILAKALFLTSILNAFAEETKIKKPIESNTTIVSNRAEMDLDSNIFRFYGDVHLEGENLDAVCDELEVISKKKEAQTSTLGGMDSFEKITAIGNVRINQTDRTIKAGHAVLYSDEGKVVLTKNPEVTNSQGTIRGHLMNKYHL